MQTNHTITKQEEKNSEILNRLNEIANAYAKIDVSFDKTVGYADYAAAEYERGFATENDQELQLIMEWQAEDKEDAFNVAEILSTEVSSVLGTEIKFHTGSDIWGVKKDAWYVFIDTIIDFPHYQPEEDKITFELGDWFVLNKTGKLFQANANDVQFPESTLEQATLWSPKVGDWCWDKHMLVKVTHISKGTREDGRPIYSLLLPMYAETHVGAVELKPFVGELPEWIKEFEK